MSAYVEDAAMTYGAGNPMWTVTYLENVSGCVGDENKACWVALNAVESQQQGKGA